MTFLTDVLDESTANELADEVATEKQEAEVVADEAEDVSDSGEKPEEQAPPPEAPVQHDDKKRHGIEAAMLAERRKRQELEAELARYRQQDQRKEPVKEPSVEDYATYEDYVADLAKYHAAQQLSELKRQEQQAVEQARQQQEQAELQDRTMSVIAAGQAKYQDFDAAINGNLAPYLNPALHRELVMSDIGHEVAYYLAKHVDELQRVASLPERQLIREIARIESVVSKPAQPEAKPVIPKTLTTTRDARGRYESPSDGPTPLADILGRKT